MEQSEEEKEMWQRLTSKMKKHKVGFGIQVLEAYHKAIVAELSRSIPVEARKVLYDCKIKAIDILKEELKVSVESGS